MRYLTPIGEQTAALVVVFAVGFASYLFYNC